MNKKKPSILVVGSMNMDLVLQTARVPLPGESLIGAQYRYVPGGKGANQAVAAARLGSGVVFVGKTGEDAHGAKLKEQLEAEGIATELIAPDPRTQTGLAIILLEASGENRIIVYPGANMEIREEQVQQAFERSYDAVMINLEISEEIVIEVCRLAEEKDIPVILDAGPAKPFDLTQVHGLLEILSPNETETLALTGLECRTPQEAAIAAGKLAEMSAARFIVIKMGEQGAFLYDHGETEFLPAHRVKTVDTTAAGDAFTAAMTAQYILQDDLSRAIQYANVAGALTVTKLGAQPSLPSAHEIIRFARDRGLDFS